MQSRIYSVAEICEGKAKLIDDSGNAVYFDISLLPAGISEGDMLRFDTDNKASHDRRLTDKKRRSIKQKQQRLTKKFGG